MFTYAESIKCAITMLFLFIVLCMHLRVCVYLCVGARVCFCSFMCGLHCYWLDCSHPPIHPIATIATDGAAGINAPGSASLINGRLTKTSDLWPLSVVTFDTSYLLHPPTAFYHWCSSSTLLYLFFQPCRTLLYPCCQCMSSVVVEISHLFVLLLFMLSFVL